MERSLDKPISEGLLVFEGLGIIGVSMERRMELDYSVSKEEQNLEQ